MRCDQVTDPFFAVGLKHWMIGSMMTPKLPSIDALLPFLTSCFVAHKWSWQSKWTKEERGRKGDRQSGLTICSWFLLVAKRRVTALKMNDNITILFSIHALLTANFLDARLTFWSAMARVSSLWNCQAMSLKSFLPRLPKSSPSKIRTYVSMAPSSIFMASIKRSTPCSPWTGLVSLIDRGSQMIS